MSVPSGSTREWLRTRRIPITCFACLSGHFIWCIGYEKKKKITYEDNHTKMTYGRFSGISWQSEKEIFQQNQLSTSRCISQQCCIIIFFYVHLLTDLECVNELLLLYRTTSFYLLHVLQPHCIVLANKIYNKERSKSVTIKKYTVAIKRVCVCIILITYDTMLTWCVLTALS